MRPRGPDPEETAANRRPAKDPRRAGVGAKLRNLRVASGESQVEIARALGWAVDYYGRLERGEHDIGIRALLDVADRFECSIDWLLGRERKLQRTGTDP